MLLPSLFSFGGVNDEIITYNNLTFFPDFQRVWGNPRLYELRTFFVQIKLLNLKDIWAAPTRGRQNVRIRSVIKFRHLSENFAILLPPKYPIL